MTQRIPIPANFMMPGQPGMVLKAPDKPPRDPPATGDLWDDDGVLKVYWGDEIGWIKFEDGEWVKAKEAEDAE